MIGFFAVGAAILWLVDIEEGRRAARAADALARPVAPVVVDVRNVGELIAGTIPDAVNIPLAQLPKRMEEIPRDRPVVVHDAVVVARAPRIGDCAGVANRVK